MTPQQTTASIATTGGAKKSKRKGNKNFRTGGYTWVQLFLLPTAILSLVFEYYPFFRTIILSFQITDLSSHPADFAELSDYAITFSGSSGPGVRSGMKKTTAGSAGRHGMQGFSV